MNTFDYKYLEIVKEILEEGSVKGDRTGTGTRSIFGTFLKHDLNEGFPLLTVRHIPFRIAFEETMFFLRGLTNTKLLEEKNIFIWQGNTTREFLDKRGLTHLPEGEMGKGYGFQWRNFGGTEDSQGVDQLQDLVVSLRDNPNSRRHLISAWNPKQEPETTLMPCHILHQYYVANGKLSCAFYMRSSDFYHGKPFNMASYALITHLLAKLLGLGVGKLTYMAGDTHLYTTQLEVAAELLDRKPKENLPTFVIKKNYSTLDEMLALNFEDVEIVGYDHSGKQRKIAMAV